MSNFVERFNWQDIERSAGDDVAAFMLKTWLRSKGMVDEELLPITPQLIIMGQPRDLEKPPAILLCGNDALASKFFGADWSGNPRLALEMMNDNYKSLVAEAYHDVENSNEPVFDLVSTELDNFALRYQRLILPFTTHTGLRFQYCYSMQLGALPVSLKISSDKLLLSGRPQNTSLCNLPASADR